MSATPSQNITLEDTLRELVKKSDGYEDWREKALAAMPEVLRPSIGPHLMDIYMDLVSGK